MGYGYYEIAGMVRGYMVDDVCNHPGCEREIDRGLSYLCYCCEKYFCEEHLTSVYCKHDVELEFQSFPGASSQCCKNCAELEDSEWNCNCGEEDGLDTD